MKRIKWGNVMKLLMGLAALIEIIYVIYMLLIKHECLTIFGCFITFTCMTTFMTVYEDLFEE